MAVNSNLVNNAKRYFSGILNFSYWMKSRDQYNSTKKDLFYNKKQLFFPKLSYHKKYVCIIF